MKQLVFATNNAHKLQEIRDILGSHYQILSLEDINCHVDIPETGATLQENALIKAKYVSEHYRIDCFADDTGLEVEALNGRPGVHTARYAYPDKHDPQANNEKLLHELSDKTSRKAQFRTVIALIQGSKTQFFEGIVKGHIVHTPQGEQGFGYDPIFSPEDTGKTFAQLGVAVKNKISHRARAVNQLIHYLAQQEPTQ